MYVCMYVCMYDLYFVWLFLRCEYVYHWESSWFASSCANLTRIAQCYLILANAALLCTYSRSIRMRVCDRAIIVRDRSRTAYNNIRVRTWVNCARARVTTPPPHSLCICICGLQWCYLYLCYKPPKLLLYVCNKTGILREYSSGITMLITDSL